ncbi:22514_t:CDS:2 [Cetraspora pellucida]|uniref:22514_t:CDS:1 n=1 Tax=Cetraspora pellucida TaxID=1433469 RepID=A0A9N9GQ10_9GLOM|nr:22514_t:CDS:2 [Cetraspora pellucida]
MPWSSSTSISIKISISTSTSDYMDDDDIYSVDPPVTTEDLYDLVKAASYLFLQRYWETLKEIRLIALFLDPRIKHLKFFIELDKSPIMSTLELTTTNDLIAALYSSKEPNNEILNKTEVDCYFRELAEKIGCNPLAW